MLYKSSFETAAQSEMVAALFELYLALMQDVKKGIFDSVPCSPHPLHLLLLPVVSSFPTITNLKKSNTISDVLF